MTDQGKISLQEENLCDVWQIYEVDTWLERLNRELVLKPFAVRLDSQISKGLVRICGILEIGFKVGALTDADGSYIKRLEPFLKIRETLVRGVVGFREFSFSRGHTDEDFAESNPNWFARLMSLDAGARDDDLLEFLSIVNQMAIDKHDHWLFRASRDSATLLKAISTPVEERTEQDRAIVGLERFLMFCGDLRQLASAGPVSQRYRVVLLYQEFLAPFAMSIILNNLNMIAKDGDASHRVLPECVAFIYLKNMLGLVSPSILGGQTKLFADKLPLLPQSKDLSPTLFQIQKGKGEEREND